MENPEINDLKSFPYIILEQNMLNLNIPDMSLAKLTNKEGLVKIGKALYQYTQNYLKIIADGDLDKLDALTSMTESDETMGIYVSKIVYKDLQSPNAKIDQSPFDDSCTQTASNNQYRIRVDHRYTESFDNFTQCKRVTYTSSIYSYGPVGSFLGQTIWGPTLGSLRLDGSFFSNIGSDSYGLSQNNWFLTYVWNRNCENITPTVNVNSAQAQGRGTANGQSLSCTVFY